MAGDASRQRGIGLDAAKAYRLLRAVMMTTVEEDKIVPWC
jgi:hypothetical protein